MHSSHLHLIGSRRCLCGSWTVHACLSRWQVCGYRLLVHGTLKCCNGCHVLAACSCFCHCELLPMARARDVVAVMNQRAEVPSPVSPHGPLRWKMRCCLRARPRDGSLLLLHKRPRARLCRHDAPQGRAKGLVRFRVPHAAMHGHVAAPRPRINLPLAEVSGHSVRSQQSGQDVPRSATRVLAQTAGIRAAAHRSEPRRP